MRLSTVFVGDRGHQSSSDLEKLARTHNSLRVKYEGQYRFLPKQLLYVPLKHNLQAIDFSWNVLYI